MKKYNLLNALIAVCLMFTSCQELTEPTGTELPVIRTGDAIVHSSRSVKLEGRKVENGTISRTGTIHFRVSLTETFEDYREYSTNKHLHENTYIEIEGLEPNTTYYYYAFDTDGISEIRGETKSFKTLNLLKLSKVTLRDWDGTEVPFDYEKPMGVSLFGSTSYYNLETNYNNGSWTFPKEINAGVISNLVAYWPYGYYEMSEYNIYGIQTYKYDGTYLLYSDYTSTNEDKSSASLVMNHAMARVIFHFSIAEDNLTDVEEVRFLDISNGENILPTEAIFNLETGQFYEHMYRYSLQYDYEFSIKKGQNTNIPIYSIPTNGGGYVTLTLNMANGNQVQANLPVEWEQGRSYEYDITYKKGMLTIGDVRIENWDNNDGGDIPIYDKN